jgi:hypothetical protein
MKRGDWTFVALCTALMTPVALLRWTRRKLDPRDWSTH